METMNEQLSQLANLELDQAHLDAVSGGFGRRSRGRSGRQVRFDVDIEIDIDVVQINGNGNVVGGRDVSIFGRR